MDAPPRNRVAIYFHPVRKRFSGNGSKGRAVRVPGRTTGQTFQNLFLRLSGESMDIPVPRLSEPPDFSDAWSHSNLLENKQ